VRRSELGVSKSKKNLARGKKKKNKKKKKIKRKKKGIKPIIGFARFFYVGAAGQPAGGEGFPANHQRPAGMFTNLWGCVAHRTRPDTKENLIKLATDGTFGTG